MDNDTDAYFWKDGKFITVSSLIRDNKILKNALGEAAEKIKADYPKDDEWHVRAVQWIKLSNI